MGRVRAIDETKKTLFEEFLVDVLFFATFAAWGLATSSATLAWIPTSAHVVFSLAASVATLTARRVVVNDADEDRNAGVAIVAGCACALVGCLDALAVTQVACRAWGEDEQKNKNPTSLSWNVDVSREVDVVLVVGAHLLGLTTSAYRARRAGHEFDVDASFVSLGAGFGIAFAYATWIVLDASFARFWSHLIVFVFGAFVVLGPVVDLLATFSSSCRSERRRWCNAAHALHAIGVVAQYVVVLANVAYLFDDRATFWGLSVPYASTCARAQGVGLLLVFAFANAHRNASMLATSSGSARRIDRDDDASSSSSSSSRAGDRTLARLAEIDPWIDVVATLNTTTSSAGPTIVAVTIAFAERASGFARFAVLGYATFAWTRGRAQVAWCGLWWEFALACVGGIVDVVAGIVLSVNPGLVRADGLETTESRIIAGVAFWDAFVAFVVAASAAWAASRDRPKVKNN